MGIPSAFVHVSESVDVERSSEEGEVGEKNCSSSKNTEGMQECEQAGEEGEVSAPRTMFPGCRRGAVSEMSLLWLDAPWASGRWSWLSWWWCWCSWPCWPTCWCCCASCTAPTSASRSRDCSSSTSPSATCWWLFRTCPWPWLGSFTRVNQEEIRSATLWASWRLFSPRTPCWAWQLWALTGGLLWSSL